MKINKEKLAQYAALSDNELWSAICDMAKKYGYNLTASRPSHSELEKIRTILRGDTQISLSEAMKILNTYKSKP